MKLRLLGNFSVIEAQEICFIVHWHALQLLQAIKCELNNYSCIIAILVLNLKSIANFGQSFAKQGLFFAYLII